MTSRKKTSRGKVLLAMSGGVDSSVAAALLIEQGYEVIGCFMRLGSVGESLDEGIAPQVCKTSSEAQHSRADHATETRIVHRGCCSVSDAADARFVASSLGIPFYVCNFKRDFGRIIDYFVESYARGHTPNPCVRCNDWLKFGKLYAYARQLGCEYVASGHYAQIVHDEQTGRAMLARGVDMAKDQSYVLFGVPAEQLEHMLLPIGSMHKHEVRQRAQELGLPVFDKPDSQEICFVPDDDYAGLIERRKPELSAEHTGPGDILDTRGRVVGAHRGQHRFTIGQRRHIGVALGYPIYVVDKNPQDNTITVGSRDDLLTTRCVAGEANWLCRKPESDQRITCSAQYRAHGRVVQAQVYILDDAPTAGPSGRRGRFAVEFASPVEGPASGQAIVLYDRCNRVIAGGWVEGKTHQDQTQTPERGPC